MQRYKIYGVLRLVAPVAFLFLMTAIIKMTRGTIKINAAGLVICLIGLVITYFGLVLWNIGDKRIFEYTESCDGYVIGHSKYYKTADSRQYFSPIYAYTVGGEEYSVKSGLSSANESSIPTIGSKAIIHYSPENPKLMQSDNELIANRKFVFCFLGVGAALLLIAAVIWVAFV